MNRQIIIDAGQIRRRFGVRLTEGNRTSHANQSLVTRIFDEYGRVTNSLDGNGIAVTNAYDSLNRLVARRSVGYGGTGTATGLESFSYDATGMTSYTDPLGHVTHFVRDSMGRVLFETNANNEVLRFTYNPSDELLTLTDGKNQTTTWNYDARGRVTQKNDAAGNTNFLYGYDAEHAVAVCHVLTRAIRGGPWSGRTF